MTPQPQWPRGPEAPAPAGPGEGGVDLLPPLDQRHRRARGTHNGTDVDIDVRCGGETHHSSHIAIFIHRSPRDVRSRTIEYVTDDASLDAAVSTGFEIARAVIDGRQS